MPPPSRGEKSSPSTPHTAIPHTATPRRLGKHAEGGVQCPPEAREHGLSSPARMGDSTGDGLALLLQTGSERSYENVLLPPHWPCQSGPCPGFSPAVPRL